MRISHDFFVDVYRLKEKSNEILKMKQEKADLKMEEVRILTLTKPLIMMKCWSIIK